MDAAARKLVQQRASNRCEYCRLPEFADPYFVFHLDHIVALQHGGGDAVENLCWSCSRCNRRKGTNLASIDQETGEQVSLFNPREQAWADHFSLIAGNIVGLTPIGRATMQLLDMNVPHRVHLRRELIAQGVFDLN